MSHTHINIRELAAWGFDDAKRDVADLHVLSERARQCIEQRSVFTEETAILPEMTHKLRPRILPLLEHQDLLREYQGLQWEIGVVDLRKLIAFQRRILLEPTTPETRRIEQEDWDALLQLAFDGRRSIEVDARHTQITEDVQQVVFHSANPDLRLHVDTGAQTPLRLHGGNPFFEVAHYRGRWFLRDGYHRAYDLIRSGVHAMFAVIVDARNIAEVGAVQPWFFDEQTLFSQRPPMVSDFHNDAVILSYSRGRMLKRITVRIEEALYPADAEQPTIRSDMKETR